MNLEELTSLNKDFAKLSTQMNKEFVQLFQKWLKKQPRLAVVLAIHMPANLILNLIQMDKNNDLPKLMPDLCQVFLRFAYPFTKVKDKWGKVSGEEFCKLYEEEYQKLFDKFFASEEEKENFKKWFEYEKEKG